jgi:hypothetical protein
MLARMPVVSVPRAFTLTQEMVAAPSKVGWLQRLLNPTNTPRFATGSVLSFALLLLIFVGQAYLGSPVRETFSIIGSGLSYPAGDAAAAPQIYSTKEADASLFELPAATPVPAEAQRNAASAQATESPAAAAAAPPTGGMGGAVLEETPAAGEGATTGAGGDVGGPIPLPTREPAATAPSSAAQAETMKSALATPAAGAGMSSDTALPGYITAQAPQQDNSERNPLSSAAEPAPSFSPLLAIELFLGALGLLMAAGAVLARRGQA